MAPAAAMPVMKILRVMPQKIVAKGNSHTNGASSHNRTRQPNFGNKLKSINSSRFKAMLQTIVARLGRFIDSRTHINPLH